MLPWIKSHLFACPIKAHLGIDCPGCGFQRSVVALFEGDIAGSLQLYPATLPFIFLIIYTLMHLRYDFRSGAMHIKILYIAVSLIVMIHYIYKILTQQLY